jgi:hypothetical protein
MNGLPAIGGFCDDLHIATFFDKTPKPRAHDPVIICQ